MGMIDIDPGQLPRFHRIHFSRLPDVAATAEAEKDFMPGHGSPLDAVGGAGAKMTGPGQKAEAATPGGVGNVMVGLQDLRA